MAQARPAMPARPSACAAGDGIPHVAIGAVLRLFDRIVHALLATAAGVSLLTCLGVMVVSVFYRYVLNDSLVWAEEVARLALVTTGFLGAALAEQRRMHIRLPYLEIRAPRLAPHLHAGFALLIVAFSLVVIYEQVAEFLPVRMVLQLPGTGLSQGVFSYPMIAGMAATGIVALRQSFDHGMRPWIGAASVVLVLVGAVYALSGLSFEDLGINPLLVTWILFFLLLAMGLPTAYAMGLVGTLYLLMAPDQSLFPLPQDMESGVNSFSLLAVPLFIFTGALLETTSISHRLMALMQVFVGRVRGGMGLVTIIGTYLFSGISGSPTADVSAIGSVMGTSLRRQGFSAGDTVGLISAATVMGHTVPPSIAVIVLAQAASLSVGTLFVAGLLPALLIGVILALFVLYRSYRLGLDRNPPMSWPEKGRAVLRGLPAILIPVILFGGLFSGVVTPTEVAALAVVAAIAISTLLLRDLSWGRFVRALVDSAAITGMALLLLSTANVLVHVSVDQRLPQAAAEWMTTAVSSRDGFLLLSGAILIVAGALLEFPALLIFGPLLLPVSAAFGLQSTHYAMFLIDALVIGHFLPPIGVLFSVTCGVTGVRLDEATRPTLVYLGIVTFGLVLVGLFPWVTLSVPRYLGLLR